MNNLPNTYSFQLPYVEKWRRYFTNVCRDLQLIQHVVNAYVDNNARLWVVTNSEETMIHIRAIVHTKIKAFTKMKQHPISNKTGIYRIIE